MHRSNTAQLAVIFGDLAKQAPGRLQSSTGISQVRNSAAILLCLMPQAQAVTLMQRQFVA